MRAPRKLLKVTGRLIRHHWLLMSTVILLFIVNGVHMIVTKRNIGARGGLSAVSNESDSLYAGAMIIAMGLGFIAFKWYICFLELKDFEADEKKN